MAKVHNKRHNTAPSDAVYIGRGSPYGNPFIIGVHGTRKMVCDIYEDWFNNLPNRDTLLKHVVGKDLVCFCKPKQCHGDFLIKQARKI